MGCKCKLSAHQDSKERRHAWAEIQPGAQSWCFNKFNIHGWSTAYTKHIRILSVGLSCHFYRLLFISGCFRDMTNSDHPKKRSSGNIQVNYAKKGLGLVLKIVFKQCPGMSGPCSVQMPSSITNQHPGTHNWTNDQERMNNHHFWLYRLVWLGLLWALWFRFLVRLKKKSQLGMIFFMVHIINAVK